MKARNYGAVRYLAWMLSFCTAAARSIRRPRYAKMALPKATRPHQAGSHSPAPPPGGTPLTSRCAARRVEPVAMSAFLHVAQRVARHQEAPEFGPAGQDSGVGRDGFRFALATRRR